MVDPLPIVPRQSPPRQSPLRPPMPAGKKKTTPPRYPLPKPSEAREQVQSKPHQQQHRASNPFTRWSERIHLPGFDLAFGQQPAPESGAGPGTPQGRSGGSSGENDSPDRTDRSTCSYGNYSLDLSIAGRAALNEHRRHVHRYGIDGGTPSRGGGIASPASSRRPGQDGGGLDADDTWDRINDAASTHVSLSSTFLVEGGGDLLRRYGGEEGGSLLGHSFLSAATDRGGEGGGGGSPCSRIDGSDYFDSSRVGLLETPERNRPLVDETSRRAREDRATNEKDSRGEAEGGATRNKTAMNWWVEREADGAEGLDTDESGRDSLVGEGDSISGSTAIGDVSGMAYLFREAMRLGGDNWPDDEKGSGDGDSDEESDDDLGQHGGGAVTERIDGDRSINASFVSDDGDKSINVSFASFDGTPRRLNGSGHRKMPAAESFVECNGGIEFVADLSIILSSGGGPRGPSRSLVGTPSRACQDISNSRQRLRGQYSTPPKRSRQFKNVKSDDITKELAGKENTDINFSVGLSPMASMAGEAAAKLLSGLKQKAGLNRTQSRLEKVEPHRFIPEGGSGNMTKGKATSSPKPFDPMSSLNDSNLDLSVSMIEPNDMSVLHDNICSPIRSSGEDGIASQIGSFDGSEMNTTGSLVGIVRNTPSEEPERSHGRLNSGSRFQGTLQGDIRKQSFRQSARVSRSLGAKYGRTDRAEGSFPPSDHPEMDSVSRSLLDSFETFLPVPGGGDQPPSLSRSG